MQLVIDFSGDELNINETTVSKNNLQKFHYESSGWQQNIISFLIDWYNEIEHVNIYTSGSTGKPKEISLLKTDMLASANATNKHFNLSIGSTYFLCLAPTYIAGMMMIVRAIQSNNTLIAVEPSNQPLINISSKKIHFAAMVPSQFYNSIKQLKTSNIEQLILGGSPLSNEVVNQLNGIKTKIYLTYGMTESITHIAVRSIYPNFENSFTALDNVNLSTDERDCLVIEPKYLSIGKLVTNDIVQLNNLTQFEWLGRFDNVINSGGVKIHPEQLESKLGTFINIPFFTYAKPHPQFGEQVCLILECTAEEIGEYKLAVSNNTSIFSKYEQPKIINAVAEFKRTDSGKIQRADTLKLLL